MPRPRAVLRRLATVAVALAVGATGLSGAEAASARCIGAAERAAATNGVPLAVLTAIAEVESGRAGPSGRAPWPWVLNHAGRGLWFEERATALARLEALVAGGDRRVDVGCFQINHRAHGQNFGSLAAMLDPERNAAYAAQFLKALFHESGSWETAIGHYHSRTPALAAAYRKRVLARPALRARSAAPHEQQRPAAPGRHARPAASANRATRLVRLYNRFRRQATRP